MKTNINPRKRMIHKRAFVIVGIVSAVVLFCAVIVDDHSKEKDKGAAEVQKILREAEGYAFEGKIPEMEASLSSAEKSAKENRIDISQEMGITRAVGYETAANETISKAFRYRQEGKPALEIENLLEKYQEYCQKAGRLPDETVILKIRK